VTGVDYSSYVDHLTTVKEYMLEMSDGVSLQIIDFCTQNISPDKPVIIFVAGWISLLSGWKEVLKVLGGKYRIIYVESREKQSSIVPDVKKVSFSMKRLALDVSDVIEKVISPSGNFILAGSSLGATAILEYCGSDKRKPLSAILVAPNTEFRFPKILELIVPAVHPALYLGIKPVIKWYLRNFRLDKKSSLEQIKKYENTLDCANPYKLKANALTLRKYALLNSMGNITIPCLVIGATSDTLHDTGNIKQLLKRIPDVAYVELATNMETHSEKAGQIMVKYIESFIDRP
jgi:pimeloyl-ACP methyl ester carboxylesterase